MKMRSLVLMCMLFVFAFAAPAQAKVDTVELFIEAVLTGDIKTLDKVLAGNYLHINANGYLQDKENFLANLKNKKMVIDRLTITDVTTSHYGDATLVTGTAQFKGTFKPALPAGMQRMTVVMERKGTEEKIILSQATPVRQAVAGGTGDEVAKPKAAKAAPKADKAAKAAPAQ